MKINDKQEIENSFRKAIEAADTDGIDPHDLGVLFGSLAYKNQWYQ